MNSVPPSLTPWLAGALPAFFLLEKVKAGEIDPYDVDIQVLIKEFEEKARELQDHLFFHLAGEFLLAVCKLLKFKLEYFFPTPPKTERERKKITIQEVQNILLEEVSPDPFEYFVHVGRPPGSKNTPKQKQDLPEEQEIPPLHKTFSIEAYIKILIEKNLISFDDFQNFFYSLSSPIEGIRFFMAWLILTSD